MNWEKIKDLICMLLLIRCCRVSIASGDSDEDLPSQNTL